MSVTDQERRRILWAFERKRRERKRQRKERKAEKEREFPPAWSVWWSRSMTRSLYTPHIREKAGEGCHSRSLDDHKHKRG